MTRPSAVSLRRDRSTMEEAADSSTRCHPKGDNAWTTPVHDIAKMIDHRLLRPTHDGRASWSRASRSPWQYDVASVCIMPYYLKRCAELLAGQRGRAEHDDRLPARRPHHRDQAGRGPAGPRRRRRRNSTWSSTSARCSAAIGITCARDIAAVVDLTHARGPARSR